MFCIEKSLNIVYGMEFPFTAIKYSHLIHKIEILQFEKKVNLFVLNSPLKFKYGSSS